MNIDYNDTHDFSSNELERLFLSVECSSGRFPDKPAVAMRNFDTVYSARDSMPLILGTIQRRAVNS